VTGNEVRLKCFHCGSNRVDIGGWEVAWRNDWVRRGDGRPDTILPIGLCVQGIGAGFQMIPNDDEPPATRAIRVHLLCDDCMEWTEVTLSGNVCHDGSGVTYCVDAHDAWPKFAGSVEMRACEEASEQR